MTCDITPAAVEAMIERLLAGDLCTVELAPVAAAMLREVARERDKTRAAIESQASAIRNLRANEESEINILRSRSRDHYIATVTLDSEREANAHLTDALLAAEAGAAALRGAIQKAHDALSPAVGDVEIVSPIAKPIYRAFGILIDALKETSDGL